MRPAKTSHGEARDFPGYAPGTELGWGAVAGGPEPAPLAIDHYRYVVFKDRELGLANVQYRSRRRGRRQGRQRHHQRRRTRTSSRSRARRQAAPVSRLGRSARRARDEHQLLQQRREGARRRRRRPRRRSGCSWCPAWVTAAGARDRTRSMSSARWSGGSSKDSRRTGSSHRTSTNGVVDRTRPLCPYPQVAVYKGPGARTTPPTLCAERGSDVRISEARRALRGLPRRSRGSGEGGLSLARDLVPTLGGLR